MLKMNTSTTVSNRISATPAELAVAIVKQADQIAYMPRTIPFWPSAIFTELTYPAIATAMKTKATASGIAVGTKLPQFICSGMSCGSMTSAVTDSRTNESNRLEGDVELWSSEYPTSVAPPPQRRTSSNSLESEPSPQISNALQHAMRGMIIANPPTSGVAFACFFRTVSG